MQMPLWLQQQSWVREQAGGDSLVRGKAWLLGGSHLARWLLRGWIFRGGGKAAGWVSPAQSSDQVRTESAHSSAPKATRANLRADLESPWYSTYMVPRMGQFLHLCCFFILICTNDTSGQYFFYKTHLHWCCFFILISTNDTSSQ